MKISTKTLNLLLDCYDHAALTNEITIEHKRDNVKNYKFLASLARGSYGDVFIVQHNTSKKMYALKRLNKEKIKKNRNTALYSNERNCMIDTRNSKYLLSLHKAFQSKSHCFFLMDFVVGGDLLSLMSRLDTLDESYIRFYTAELILAFKELHSLGYLHRDVKPDNILITQTGHVKLGDFGSCVKTINGTVKSAVSVGTPDYISPEVLSSVNCENEYGFEVDVWSLGVVVYEMVNGETPFYSHSLVDTYRKISKIDWIHNKGSDSLKELISSMLVKKEKRATLDELMNFEFFKGTDFDNLQPCYLPSKEWNVNFTDSGFLDDDNDDFCTYDGFVGFTYDNQVEITDSCDKDSEKSIFADVEVDKNVSKFNMTEKVQESTERNNLCKKERFEIFDTTSQSECKSMSKNKSDNTFDGADAIEDEENISCDEYKRMSDVHNKPSQHVSCGNKIVPECIKYEMNNQSAKLTSESNARCDSNIGTRNDVYQKTLSKFENLELQASQEKRVQEVENTKTKILHKNQHQNDNANIIKEDLVSNKTAENSKGDEKDFLDNKICQKCSERQHNEDAQRLVRESFARKTKDKQSLNKLVLRETHNRILMYTENLKSQHELISNYVDHLIMQNKYLKKEIRKKESKIDYENVKFMEELKKELRQKKMEIRELEQKVEEEVLMRQRLEDEIKYVKSQSIARVSEIKREFHCKKVLMSNNTSKSIIQYKEVSVLINGGNISIDNECDTLNHIYVEDLKEHEMYFVGEKKRKLIIKVIFLPNIESSVGSSTRCEDDLMKDLKKEENMLQGLNNLLKIVKGKVFDDAKQQQQGSLNRIEQLKEEIKKSKSGTIISVEKGVRTKEFNNHRFANKTFKETTICYHCNQILYGSFDQGYCCIDCNMITHKSCYVLINESCELHKAIKNGRLHYLMMRSIEEKEKMLKIIKNI